MTGWDQKSYVYIHLLVVFLQKSKKLKRQYTYLHCQKSNIICTRMRSDSLINTAIGVLGYILVIEWICLLISF